MEQQLVIIFPHEMPQVLHFALLNSKSQFFLFLHPLQNIYIVTLNNIQQIFNFYSLVISRNAIFPMFVCLI